ncbi:hypothetical protein NLI96_g12876 [Meripilus lineatus]|uniref:Tyr recombinase domain-containing protein n=1 Tax=Meripilus lineatus TaxID=2056292 RepID=A0AAD5Y7T5_9APHY|nr:hypothetical protein NLI96_g12876 [Physisporinus lineatus]
MSHHIKPTSVDSYLSGICHQLEHLYPEVRKARQSHLVARTLKGCKRLYNTPTKRKRPLSTDDLEILLNSFPPLSHDNLLFRTLLLCGFFALHRLGELAWPDNPKARSSRKLIRRASVTFETDTCSYTLPGHKGDALFEGSTVVLAKRDDCMDPIAALAAYIEARDCSFPYHPQLFLTSSGTPPTRHWFLSRMLKVISDNVGGHSLRAGGATHFAACGWPDDRIQALGRWSSSQYRIYIRKNPVILQALLNARSPITQTPSTTVESSPKPSSHQRA